VLPTVRGLEKIYGARLQVQLVNIHNKSTLALQQEFGFTATPEFFLLDSTGKIRAHWDEGNITTFKQAIDKIMAESP